jgi:hypothetical protein
MKIMIRGLVFDFNLNLIYFCISLIVSMFESENGIQLIISKIRMRKRRLKSEMCHNTTFKVIF